VDSLPLELWTTDTELRIVTQNAASRQSQGNLTGRPVEDLDLPAEGLSRLAVQHRQALRGLTSREEQERLVDGETRVFEVLVTPLLQDGRVLGAIGTAEDVTDFRRVAEETDRHHRRLEKLVAARTRELVRTNDELQDRIADHRRSLEALYDSEEKYRALVENASEVIFLVSAEGRMLYISPAIEPLTHYAADEIVGREFSRFVVPEDLPGLMASFAETLSGNRGPYEFRIVTKSGETRYVRTSSSPMFKDGRPVGLIGVLSDLTETRRTQEMLQRSVEKLRLAMEGIVRAMVKTVEIRDPFTSGHQQMVADLALALAKELGLPEDKQEALRMAGLIHDIGKVAVPAEILSRPGGLSEPEMVLVRSHPAAGYNILRTIDFPWPIADIVLQHHERLDGSGYPSGLRGPEIMFEARILAVADVIAAASSHRPYRQAEGVGAALSEVETGAGTLYDRDVVAAVLRLFREKGFRLGET
jgi:PAS domain S-box-containing protein/putative nucleotidyltransferase with HDIG domain